MAGIIIGDEILGGKVREENAPLIIDLCRETGAVLERLVVVGDEIEAIADEVTRAAERYDVVITSGGLGPTHDDRTVEAVAVAFGVPVVRLPELESLIRHFWGKRFTEAALRMADVPEGTRLVHGGRDLLPLAAFHNIYLLPGVPRLFAAMVPWIRRDLSGPALVMHGVYLSSYESDVAPLLSQIDEDFPEVKIGSYPRLWVGDHRLWVTLEGQDADAVKSATRALLDGLPPEEIVRVED